MELMFYAPFIPLGIWIGVRALDGDPINESWLRNIRRLLTVLLGACISTFGVMGMIS